jgi:hypothetical protein
MYFFRNAFLSILLKTYSQKVSRQWAMNTESNFTRKFPPWETGTKANWIFMLTGYCWTLKPSLNVPCRPLLCRAAKRLDCVFPIWFTQCGRVWFTHVMPWQCHTTTMPFWKRLLKATAQRGMGMVWHMWISIGRPKTEFGRPARIRLLPATTRNYTKFIRSIPIR